MTDIKEHPILYSAPLVRAYLAGRKTQTRRIVTARNSIVDGDPRSFVKFGDLDLSRAWVDQGPSPAGNPGPYLKAPHRSGGTVHRIYPRWAVGDRLWGRESHRFPQQYDNISAAEIAQQCLQAYDYPWCPTEFEADGFVNNREPDFGAFGKLRPSIFLPRWAARIYSEITQISVERVQDISEEGAKAEGVGPGWATDGDESYVLGFLDLWDKINGKREGGAWDENPWVWVVSFRRLGTPSDGESNEAIWVREEEVRP